MNVIHASGFIYLRSTQVVRSHYSRISVNVTMQLNYYYNNSTYLPTLYVTIYMNKMCKKYVSMYWIPFLN